MTKEEAKKILTHLRNGKSDLMLMDALDMAISALSAEPCREADDYENEIADLHNRLDIAEYDKERYKEEITTLEAKNKGEWIPIVTRPMTEEEKEEYLGEYDPNEIEMYACPIPEDGQEVLVTTRFGDVTTDTFYRDDGYYFETYCDDGEVIAWQPKPEPYKKGE